MKLRKRDVEALLANYDADPVAALTVALRVALDRPDAEWDELIMCLDVGLRPALVASDTAALDTLAAELNELRSPSPRFT